MKFLKYILLFVTVGFFIGCANMGAGPTGGARDFTPPTYESATPAQNAKNVSTKRVEILFNEYLQINDANNLLTVSPPQKPVASSKVVGKKLIVELKDSLKPNTTYTLDFNGCIGDYTENNLIENYCHTFSTGDNIDSLVIAGYLVDAKTLTPVENVLVGIYSDYKDSSFFSTPFDRIARTDKNGRFSIKGCAAKAYKIFALEDMNGNYFFDQKGEGIALQETPLPIPSVYFVPVLDTVMKKYIPTDEELASGIEVNTDSLIIDTVIAREKTLFSPDSVYLRFFRKEERVQEFKRIERTTRNALSVSFEKCDSSMPILTPLNFDSENWYVLEKSEKNDSLKFWIVDTTVMKLDTMMFTIEYLKFDSLENLIPQLDTIKTEFNAQFLKNEKKKEKEQMTKKIRYEKLGKVMKRENVIKFSSKSQMLGYGQDYQLTTETPISSIDLAGVHFSRLIDSVQTPQPFSLTPTDNPRVYLLKAEIIPEEKYLITFDSLSVKDHYGNYNDSVSFRLSRKPDDEYGSIKFNIYEADFQVPVYVQLLSKDDKVLRMERMVNNTAFFHHVAPDTYYAKLFADLNRNGKWDTGEFSLKNGIRQPEDVRYFPKALKLRKGWDMEEDWHVNAVDLNHQRMPEITVQEKKKN